MIFVNFRKNTLARAGGEPGCLLYLWISLGFSSENQEKSVNQWKSGSEEKKNLSRLKDYGGWNEFGKDDESLLAQKLYVWAGDFPRWLKLPMWGQK